MRASLVFLPGFDVSIKPSAGHHAAADDLWWSSWYDSGALYWVLTCGVTPVDGGVVNLLHDEELRTALSIVLLRSGVTPAWPVPDHVAGVNLDGFLEQADAPDELRLTSTLARLLPDALRKVGDRDRRLFMSVPSELTPVPWPILPVGVPGPRVTRLVERFELRFMPSLAVLDGVRRDSALAAAANPLPLLLTCDYFPVDGVPGALPPRRAQTILAARELCDSRTGIHEATTMNLTRWLRWLPRETEGVAFFRAHYEWVEADPGSSGIALADGVFLSGLLGVRDATSGLPILNLPRTVVMSCCSTSGNQERNGGESLGLAPLAMMAGARRLIACMRHVG
ncbi:CHAT domain-containing protein [Micromonospora sp. CA-111912]|uniref:CHAT domain-containing protein n=1 Tax=Micromonospora sp. CA-111912 TaxID=3239955 RepID=UPI003D9373C8